jgi:hypothetical protein
MLRLCYKLKGKNGIWLHYTHLVILGHTCLVMVMLEKWFRGSSGMVGPKERSLGGIVRSNRLRTVRV